MDIQKNLSNQIKVVTVIITDMQIQYQGNTIELYISLGSPQEILICITYHLINPLFRVLRQRERERERERESRLVTRFINVFYCFT